MDHNGFDDRRYDQDSGAHPDMRKDRPPPRRGDLARPEPVEGTLVYGARSGPPPGPRRNRWLPLVIALAVALVLVVGILIGVLVGGGSSSTAAQREPSPTTAPAPRPTTSAPSTTRNPTTTAATETGAAPTSGAGGPVQLTGRTGTEQLRVTPSGQDLDDLVGDGDGVEEALFSADSNEFDFRRATARWPQGTAPTAEDCARQIQRQPLSSSERANLDNNPPASVCTYTSHDNIAHVTALGAAEGEGVQVSVTVWQTVE